MHSVVVRVETMGVCSEVRDEANGKNRLKEIKKLFVQRISGAIRYREGMLLVPHIISHVSR